MPRPASCAERAPPANAYGRAEQLVVPASLPPEVRLLGAAHAPSPARPRPTTFEAIVQPGSSGSHALARATCSSSTGADLPPECTVPSASRPRRHPPPPPPDALSHTLSPSRRRRRRRRRPPPSPQHLLILLKRRGSKLFILLKIFIIL